MMNVSSYYDVKVVEIEISGDDKQGYFEDKIVFIFDNLIDRKNNSTLYEICENKVNEYMQYNTDMNTAVYNAFTKIYTLDRQLINQFDVL